MLRGLLETLRRWWQRAWCRLIANLRPLLNRPPHVRCWLLLHPNVANAIKWQFEFQSTAYDVPETAKRRYFSWTGAEQAELQAAFDAAWAWLESPGTPADPSGEGLGYPPKNLNDTTNEQRCSLDPGCRVMGPLAVHPLGRLLPGRRDRQPGTVVDHGS